MEESSDIPLVRTYCGYQQICVRTARLRDPETTIGLTDRQVRDLLMPPAGR